jgi:hypothetical protein
VRLLVRGCPERAGERRWDNVLVDGVLEVDFRLRLDLLTRRPHCSPPQPNALIDDGRHRPGDAALHATGNGDTVAVVVVRRGSG